MKKLLFFCLLPFFIIESEPPVRQEDPTEKYRNYKADESLIHDTYYEAQRYDKELPAHFKDTLEKFGFKEGDINFYTAVRTDQFVERIGNNLIILRPNFFFYLTPAEQSAYLGLKLVTLNQGERFDMWGSHQKLYKPESSKFYNDTTFITLLALGICLGIRNGNNIIEKAYAMWPYIKNATFSKEGAIVAAGAGICVAKRISELHEDFKRRFAIEKEVINRLGPEGLLSIREKQAHWGNNKSSWIGNKWNRVLSKLNLVYDAQTSLEKFKNK